jgi:uncharacterized membrane protein YdjX (TVP38/TMEM64 family)
MFLRMTGVNVILNITAPLAGVPVSTFFWGALIGLLPVNFVQVQCGLYLKDIDNIEDFTTRLSVTMANTLFNFS